MKIEIKNVNGIEVVNVGVSSLNQINVIDTKGDLISFENLTESIRNNGVLEPIFIDTKNNIISGNRRVAIAKDLGLKTIPAIVVDEKLSEFEIDNLRIDFLTTNRNLSYIDISKVYYYQKMVFEKHNQSYSDYMAEKLECSSRAIEFKIRAGKMYSQLPIEIQSIFQTIDSTKKVPLKTLKVMSKLDEVKLKNFNKDILGVEDIVYEDVVSITKEYDEMLISIARQKKIDKEVEEAKKETLPPKTEPDDEPLTELSSETDLEENSSNETEPQNELSSKADSEKESLKKDETPIEPILFIDAIVQDNSHIIKDMKKVFQYEIKKSFNQKIKPSEKQSVEDIQSKLHLDFDEEIELIKSLLKGDL